MCLRANGTGVESGHGASGASWPAASIQLSTGR